MITVLQVAESGGWAGGETYLLMLARRLDRSRFRLVVVSPEQGTLEILPLVRDLYRLVYPAVERLMPRFGGERFAYNLLLKCRNGPGLRRANHSADG